MKLTISNLIAVEALLDRINPKIEALRAAEGIVDRLQSNLEKAMAKAQEFLDLLSTINLETDRIAAEVQRLIDLVSASGLTGAEEAEILTGLAAVRDRLTGIGQSEDEPVPTPEPA